MDGKYKKSRRFRAENSALGTRSKINLNFRGKEEDNERKKNYAEIFCSVQTITPSHRVVP